MTNPTQAESLRAWLEQSAGEPYAFLTTVGRRTGRQHRIQIWFAVHDERIYVMSGGRDRSDWVHNLKANPNVSVELSGESRAGIARVIAADSAEDPLVRELLVTKYRKNEDDLVEWGRNSLPIAIEFS